MAAVHRPLAWWLRSGNLRCSLQCACFLTWLVHRLVLALPFLGRVRLLLFPLQKSLTRALQQWGLQVIWGDFAVSGVNQSFRCMNDPFWGHSLLIFLFLIPERVHLGTYLVLVIRPVNPLGWLLLHLLQFFFLWVRGTPLAMSILGAAASWRCLLRPWVLDRSCQTPKCCFISWTFIKSLFDGRIQAKTTRRSMVAAGLTRVSSFVEQRCQIRTQTCLILQVANCSLHGLHSSVHRTWPAKDASLKVPWILSRFKRRSFLSCFMML